MQQAIEMDLEIKFGKAGLEYAPQINDITDLQQLKSIMKAVKFAESLEDMERLFK